jgi:hypothetical protein
MTVSRVVKAGRIVKERAITDGGVGVALGVAKKRQYSSGCVVETCGLVDEALACLWLCLRSLTRLWSPMLKRSVPAPTAVL